jgi:hypothetical protein
MSPGGKGYVKGLEMVEFKEPAALQFIVMGHEK